MDEAIVRRLERIESTQAIQMLPSRYALAVDSRDIDTLVNLFVPGVDAGKWGRGRAGLRAFYESVLVGFYRSQHQICGHVFDFVDEDLATGTTYCRAEHEDGDNWVVMIMTYFDEYERVDGRWYFRKHLPSFFYATNIDERPCPPFAHWPDRDLNPKHFLGSHAYATWKTFWERQDSAAVDRLTHQR
ncbi:nuclear transport factor 2 family protein [Novosphingobium sp. G106]|uniref:nuclear transport factor 2 family protein n=1 Tax=Novosphingobium sp. G106 TaxID=2849500 RepID=UPI001C2DE48D|nr:nuclear transport factor 2 family protein [Novosphingobium sp. G106]MBV1688942.1 nuclear transport factor 2 family protein [Novosphingobium sp. G106]